ncbi:unnamed protein product (macronuclear) [Paramecium tetraurelia]|uniref:GtrA-like protein domain-containing protein n=1 Tax=Paramecium tetraurelia TaxID=5888 RepID=A0BJK8_PARTE|nr:uncharacterized protein GSPATT00029353001 [Paramecium tetraurelia]CAK58725.1 unnamed protein product [Paramecium tetraurelia]|eukprot:XP_001426123.1 hypothetical protein (macronuclear) [Paramecium tetraurelia strain d4-2]
MNPTFKIVKKFNYRRKENRQMRPIQPFSPQRVNDVNIQMDSQVDNNKKNKYDQDEIKDSTPLNKKNLIPSFQYSRSTNQPSKNNFYQTPPEIPKKLPQLFLPFVLSFIVNLGLGIAIFATQGDQTAIIVFEVFMILLNIISGAYYYTKSTEIIVTRPKCFYIFFGTILAEFLCLFIQLLISWITKASFAIQIPNIISVTIFLLYFYYKRKQYYQDE